MEYRLSGAGADIEDGSIALLDIAMARDVGGSEMAAADQFGISGFGFFQAREMLSGDNKNVRGSLRADIFEGEYVIVLVDFFRGNFAAKDAAEEAVGVGHWLLTLRQR
jgi:hypothetical protein